jgi:hypothetical protein
MYLGTQLIFVTKSNYVEMGVFVTHLPRGLILMITLDPGPDLPPIGSGSGSYWSGQYKSGFCKVESFGSISATMQISKEDERDEKGNKGLVYEEELGRKILELGRLLAPLHVLLQGQVPQRNLNQRKCCAVFWFRLSRNAIRTPDSGFRILVFVFSAQKNLQN